MEAPKQLAFQHDFRHLNDFSYIISGRVFADSAAPIDAMTIIQSPRNHKTPDFSRNQGFWLHRIWR